jgi:uncharacterized membrane protein YgcG
MNAYELGIVRGIGGGLFSPYAAISRQEIAVMLFNAINAINESTGKDILNSTTTAVAFADAAVIADWAAAAVRSLRNNEIMLGDDRNRFNPVDNTTKEMAFILVNRIYMIYSGLDAKKAFPAAYTGEILMRIKGGFNNSGEYQIIGDIYELYPAASTDDIDRYMSGEPFVDSEGFSYIVDRSASLSESVAAGYAGGSSSAGSSSGGASSGGTSADGAYYPVYVLVRDDAPQHKLYVVLAGTMYMLYSDSGHKEPFFQKTFSDVLFAVPDETTVVIGEAGNGVEWLAGAALQSVDTRTFLNLQIEDPGLLNNNLWLVRLTRGRVTRLTTLYFN